jgi:hypothetical protein
MLELTREEEELIRLLRGLGGEFQLMITSRYGHVDVSDGSAGTSQGGDSFSDA